MSSGHMTSPYMGSQPTGSQQFGSQPTGSLYQAERVLVVEWQQGSALAAIPDTLARIIEAGNSYQTYTLIASANGRELQAETELKEVLAHNNPDAVLVVQGSGPAGSVAPQEARSQNTVSHTVALGSNIPFYRYMRSSSELEVLKDRGIAKKFLIQTNNPIMDPFAGFRYDLFERLPGGKIKPKMLPTLLQTALMFVLGSVVSFMGGVIHTMNGYVPQTQIPFPLGIIIAVTIITLVTFSAQGLISSRVPMIGLIAGIVFTLALMSLYPIQGTQFIQDNLAGMSWMVLGSLVPLAITMWPRFPKHYPEIV